MFLLGCVGVVGALVAWGCLALWSGNALGAASKAKIINQNYGTAYTASDIFFAEDIIDEVRQVKRHRIDAKVEIEETDQE